MNRFAGLFPALALAAGLGAALPAFADIASSKAQVDAAKARGEVGEQADGFLGVVGGAGPGVASAVAEINAGRADAYRQAAAAAGTSSDLAGAAAARQLFVRTPPGQYVKPAGGGWQRK